MTWGQEQGMLKLKSAELLYSLVTNNIQHDGIDTEYTVVALENWTGRTQGEDFHGQRSQSETVNSTLKQKYGAFVRSRHWRKVP